MDFELSFEGVGNKMCPIFATVKKEFERFFTTNRNIVYWKEDDKLMRAVRHEQISENWRLIIDFAKLKSKALLLHNRIDLLSNLFRQAVHTKYYSYVQLDGKG
jgi:hypothetical protein